MADATDADARRKALALLEAKFNDRLRFAVSTDDERYSTAWSVWEHADSVYIAGRTLGGVMKVSLHPAGGYRLALTKEHFEEQSYQHPLPARDFVSWPRPDVSDGKTISLVASVFFPTEYLKSTKPPASVGKPYLLFEAARPGWATEVAFFLSATDPEVTERALLNRQQKPIYRWSMDDGTHISMAIGQREFDPATLLPRSAHPSLRGGDGLPSPGESRSGLTGLFWNEPGPGTPLQLVELGGITLKNNRGPDVNDPIRPL